MNNMALAYAMKKRGKKMGQEEDMHKPPIGHPNDPGYMAHGGKCMAHGSMNCGMCHGGKMMAEGGNPGSDYSYNSIAPSSTAVHFKNKWIDTVHPNDVKKAVQEHAKSHPMHKAHGGFIEAEEASGYKSMPKEHEKMDHMALEEDDRKLNQHGAQEVGAEGMHEDDEHHTEHDYSHPVENQDDHEDMVGRIMRQRAVHYSKGGRVANDTPITAGFEDNQFDDLVKDDDLNEHYTGKNSGDELGDAQEDEDRNDMVSRIMRSRRLKNRGGSGSNERIA